MKINDAGIELIKEFEGLRLEAYPDPGTGGDPWTIGYGSTKDVSPGLVITEEEATERLREDVGEAERCVSNACAGVPLTDNQFAALVAWAFNVGCNAMRSSTLIRKLRSGDEDGAAQEFLRWNRAGGRPMAGLTRRRQAEKDLFLS